MSTAFILLGGNEDNTYKLFEEVKQQLSSFAGTIKSSSSIYKSQPWGFDSNKDFLNQVIVLKTDLAAQDLLKTTQKIEILLGRTIKTTDHYTNRSIDIDILFFNNEVFENETLTIPHPQIPNRRFTLMPLNEVAPKLQHPVLNLSMEELLHLCEDESLVINYQQKDENV